ncbi:hypothetical protein [Streptomyces sp. NPDC091212]|uniref:hypothetical protein n=1 Tax=Streptomyces sp. NPDC091212 TaxID=3155191 RepID=UPI0034449451
MKTSFSGGISPPLPTKTRLLGAGGDAVRVARFHALQALDQLRTPGAVAVNPMPVGPSVLFLVQPGNSSSWNVPQTVWLEEGSFDLPLGSRQAPPGVYWLIPPRHGCRLWTDVVQLQRVLRAVLGLVR